MRRAKWFVGIFIYLLIYSLLVQSLGFTNNMSLFVDPSTIEISSGIFGGFLTSVVQFAAGISNIFVMLFGLITFQVPELPALLVMLTIYPALFILLFMILDILLAFFGGSAG